MEKAIAKSIIRIARFIVGSICDTGKVNINLFGGDKTSRINFLGLTLFDNWKQLPYDKASSYLPDIYLKVNKPTEYSLKCIQQWLDVANCMKRNVIIVCDDKLFENKIVRTCYFHSKVRFIKSDKTHLKNIIRYLYSGFWKNATYAHLTPFVDSKHNGKKMHWNIDGDDTLFLMSPEKVARLLKLVEDDSINENITFNSLDMWYSRTNGHHWSLGVLFVNDNCNVLKIMNETKNLSWGDKFKQYTKYLNLDWYITHLKIDTEIKVRSFYPNKAWFVHWGSFLMSPLGSGVYFYNNGEITFPIITDIYKDMYLGRKEIRESVLYELGLSEEEGPEYLGNEICYERNDSEQVRKLHDIPKNRYRSTGIIPF